MLKAKYVHTNLIAENWRELARFYEVVFGCQPVPPLRDFSGEKLDAGTGLSNAVLHGIHLRLPGQGEDGPTLEIFNYNRLVERPGTAVNRPGFGHIAFQVENVFNAREQVLAAGGKTVGEIVTLPLADGRVVTWCYVTDPERNIIEIQSWGNPGREQY